MMELESLNSDHSHPYLVRQKMVISQVVKAKLDWPPGNKWSITVL